jgi:V/A-type H+-transporting ATPase subunit F
VEYFFIGDSELVCAFRFVGVDGGAVETREEALELFRKHTSERSGGGASSADGERERILILQEEAAHWLSEELTEWQLKGDYPLVVEIPGLGGHLEGRKTLVDGIREAIGISV